MVVPVQQAGVYFRCNYRRSSNIYIQYKKHTEASGRRMKEMRGKAEE